MFNKILEYAQINPFLFAIAIQQIIAGVFYAMINPTPTRIKLGILTVGYALCNFILMSIK